MGIVSLKNAQNVLQKPTQLRSHLESNERLTSFTSLFFLTAFSKVCLAYCKRLLQHQNYLVKMSDTVFLFTSESVNEGHPGK